MRRIMIIAFLILLAALMVIFAIKNREINTNVTANTTKVGVILNGTTSDLSFCQTHYEALENIKDDLNLQIIYRENVSKDCFKTIKDLIEEENCNIIIGVSYEFGEKMLKAAQVYPNVCFFHTSGIVSRKNLSTYFGRMYQVRYLAGIVAGQNTKTGKIGYVASFPISEVIRGINAFTLGIRSVRPEATVYVRYTGSWEDDEPAKYAARDLIERVGVDVITTHTDSIAPIIEANKSGIYSIGYHLDNSNFFMDTYLTACVWNWQAYYYDQIHKCLQGKFRGSQDWIDMDEGIVALAPYSHRVDDETKKIVEETKEKLKRIDFDVFYGPITDNNGNLRVKEGEAMTDAEMLTSFDWYVEGVKIEYR